MSAQCLHLMINISTVVIKLWVAEARPVSRLRNRAASAFGMSVCCYRDIAFLVYIKPADATRISAVGESLVQLKCSS